MAVKKMENFSVAPGFFMNDMSLLSIVTITFNNFDELLHTVESVKDLKCCEHLIINGGKCQKTLEFLQIFSGKSISEPDQGISDAFNKGIKLSQGSAVMLLNSGDILLDQTYPEKALHILKEHPEADFVHANELYDDAMIGEFVMRPLRKHNNLYPNIGKGMPYRHQTMVVRRRIYDKVGSFDLKYVTSDFDWTCRWEVSHKHPRGIAFYFEGKPVIKMDGKGVSTVREWKVMLEAIKIIRIHYPFRIVTNLTLLMRLMFFAGRELLKFFQLKNVLFYLKHRKYKSVTQSD